MKAILLVLLATLLAAFCAHGALGENPEQCLDRYKELFETKDGDSYHAQNTVRLYRDATVVFNRKDIAIEITFSGKKITEPQIKEWLAPNGNGWVKVKPPLGSAMQRLNDRWTTPDGRQATLQHLEGSGDLLTISSPERLQQIAERTKAISAAR